jgi:hypothetical protein
VKWPATAAAAAIDGLTRWCPPAASLPALEVAVARRRAPLARAERIRIHPEAHRAPRLAPLDARVAENPVEPSLSAARLTACEPGHDERAHRRVDVVAAQDGGGGAQVLDAAFVHEPMKTRSTRTSSIAVPGSSAM